MNRPSASVRMMGSATGARLLLFFCAFMVVGVFAGGLPWVVLLVALLLASVTVNSVQKVRSYNAWAGEWQAMATGKAVATKSAARKMKKRPKLDLAVGVASLVVIPWLWNQVSDEGEKLILAGAWLVMFVAVVVVAMRRKKAHRVAPPKAAAQVQAVAWLMAPASSSPSRAEAMRELPEYSARLLA